MLSNASDHGSNPTWGRLRSGVSTGDPSGTPYQTSAFSLFCSPSGCFHRYLDYAYQDRDHSTSVAYARQLAASSSSPRDPKPNIQPASGGSSYFLKLTVRLKVRLGHVANGVIMSKHAIAVGFALLFLFSSFGIVNAQIPAIAVYFDTGQNKDCLGVGILETLAVVGLNYPACLSSAEFAISYPLAVAFLGDIPGPGTLTIGNSPTGITVMWAVPPGGIFQPILILNVDVMWLCDSCEPPFIDNLICPVPHPGSGFLGFRDCSGSAHPAVGICAGICLTNPTEETTWGKVKALYSE